MSFISGCLIPDPTNGGNRAKLWVDHSFQPGVTLPQTAERDQPAGFLYFGDAMFPFMPRFALEEIDGTRGKLCGDAFELPAIAPPEPHRSRLPKRYADHVLEHRAISVPADAGARIIADEQGLDEIVRPKARKMRRSPLYGQEPRGNRIGWRKLPGLEVIAPSKAAGEPLACPLLVAKWVKTSLVDALDERPLLLRRDEVILLGEAGQQWGCPKQVALQAVDGHHHLYQKVRLV